MAEYPEHEKMKSAKETLGTEYVGAFLEWLRSETPVVLAEFDDGGQLWLTSKSIQGILEEYADIDPNKIEAERMEMLVTLRGAH